MIHRHIKKLEHGGRRTQNYRRISRVRIGRVRVNVRPSMFNRRGEFLGVFHCRRDVLILKKGDNTVHHPDGRKEGDGEEPVEVEPEHREAGTGGIQM